MAQTVSISKEQTSCRVDRTSPAFTKVLKALWPQSLINLLQAAPLQLESQPAMQILHPLSIQIKTMEYNLHRIQMGQPCLIL